MWVLKKKVPTPYEVKFQLKFLGHQIRTRYILKHHVFHITKYIKFTPMKFWMIKLLLYVRKQFAPPPQLKSTICETWQCSPLAITMLATTLSAYLPFPRSLKMLCRDSHTPTSKLDSAIQQVRSLCHTGRAMIGWVTSTPIVYNM